MEIVIDIDEDTYKDLTQTGENTINLGVLLALRKAVRNGTPLSKGHGKIMDVDKIIKKMEEREERLKDGRSMYEASCVEVAIDMFGETIIEADAESEE